MSDLFKRGESFYYENRNTKQAEKCTVIEWVLQHPMAYIAKKEISGEVFKCYHILVVLNQSKKHTMMLRLNQIELYISAR